MSDVEAGPERRHMIHNYSLGPRLALLAGMHESREKLAAIGAVDGFAALPFDSRLQFEMETAAEWLADLQTQLMEYG
jgi:hypothetical protein